MLPLLDLFKFPKFSFVKEKDIFLIFQLLGEQKHCRNNEALTNHKDKWEPWFSKLSDALSTLHASQDLRAAADYAVAWREIAEGLEAVGQ